jgi:hypothetical protein
MKRVIRLTMLVGFVGTILVLIQGPFRSHAAPDSVGLELAVSATCRILGVLLAVVASIELLLRVSSDRAVTNIGHWVVVLLAALCLCAPTWSAPISLAIVAAALVVVPVFSGQVAGRSGPKATNEQPPSENSPDFTSWKES